MLPGGVVFPCVIGFAVLAAVLIGPSRGRRALAILCGSLSFLSAVAVQSDPPLLATTCGLFSLLAPVKISQLLVERRSFSARFRIWHMLSPFDARTTTHVRASVDLRRLALVALYSALFVAGLLMVLGAEALPGTARNALRVLGGGLGVYSGTEALGGMVLIAHRLAGICIEPFHRAPILSRSLAEFWGQRWNRPVHAWLRDFFFFPLLRRGRARVGVLLAFTASAAIHAWIVLQSVGRVGALSMVAFFLLQGLLMLIENRLAIRRRSPLVGRIWTLGTFALCAYLFVEPLLSAVGL